MGGSHRQLDPTPPAREPRRGGTNRASDRDATPALGAGPSTPEAVGRFGSWDWDLTTDTMQLSDRTCQIFGIQPLTPVSREQMLELVHPQDRAGVAEVLATARTTRRGFAHEYRALRGDGTVLVIELNGELVLDPGQRAPRLLGTVSDITDRRRAETERRNLATVLDSSDDAITTCSLDGVFLTWNRGAEKLYGYTAEEAIGQPLDLIIPVGERAKEHLNWERLINDEPVRSLETVRLTKDGRTVVVAVTRSLIIDATRGVIGVASVGRDITEHKRAQALLAAAHADAVAASELKSRFLANMSHEIRTPMNGVIGISELLLGTELSAEQRSYAEQIARSGEDMMRIINDILDISKIEAGQLELEVRDFNLHEAIEHACALAGLEARAKGLALEVQIAAGVPRRVHGDGQRLCQVVLNLVSNAVKFTQQGTVAVRASRAGGARIRIEIADTGIGIEPHALHRMFEPFTQADASTTRRYGGTGLGLAIARDLVGLMGGRIGAESQPGQGSTFWFELEMAAADNREPASRTPARANASAGRQGAATPLELVPDLGRTVAPVSGEQAIAG
ncbi:MAG: PAS domain S-box protein [Solirubrobacteraceae bacterium]|jgi:PAS domain S-box-containing protein